MVMTNEESSWTVFDILESCWQTALKVLLNFGRILPKIVC